MWAELSLGAEAARRQIKIFGTSAVTGMGIKDSFEWLVQAIELQH